VIVRPAPWHLGPGPDVDWDGQDLAPGARGHMATFARELARTCLSAGAQVVLTRATPWRYQGIAIGMPAPLAVDVVELMVASDCVVVPAGRMPSPTARAAAMAWGVERLLVAPALHDGDVLAIGLAALPGQVRPDMVEAQRAGACLGAALASWSSRLQRQLAPV
jgi:hypothetical protein